MLAERYTHAYRYMHIHKYIYMHMQNNIKLELLYSLLTLLTSYQLDKHKPYHQHLRIALLVYLHYQDNTSARL